MRLNENKQRFMSNAKGLFVSLLIMFPLLSGCVFSKKEARPEDTMVEAAGKYLTQKELRDAITPGLTLEDSIKFSERYIENWIKDVLLFENARRNISDIKRIEELANQYRRRLIIYEYEKMMVSERLANDISEDELKSYLVENEDLFALKKPLLKGLFLKVPTDAPQLAEVKKWMKKFQPDTTLEQLEKYSLKNAIVFDYFFDHWVEFDVLMGNIPYRITDLNGFLRTNKFLEVTDGDYWYFVYVNDYQLSGAVQPYEYARPRIMELVVNEKKRSFFRSVETQLYDEALQKNEIKFYGIEPPAHN